ncbi:sialate O-acetylesterase [Phyllobacterium sp. A18/5-2]|uniref:sialate O-acetylesterase n=1 Tax=Phyllobacterium sp. A18/5-2 TaxID=2978392 RepID=UPI0021CA35C7|nr:sialate O-acetylesterase [Phyllobacterium sp. A18/5-2]UXN62922.1 sialate O-acetylesterase [Phyllobacterium sp. A18/5-2]
MSGYATLQDPFVYVTPGFDADRWNRDTRSRTIRAAQGYTAGETTAVLIVAGQSLAANTSGDQDNVPYAPTNGSKIDMMLLDDGGIYVANDPLLGCENSSQGNVQNQFFRMADKLITAGWRQRIILIPIAIGATSSANWESTLWQRVVIANERAKAKGLNVDLVTWQQGESDSLLGVTASAYTANVSSMINKVAASGVAAPWMVAKGSYASGSVYPAIQNGQIALWDLPNVFQGPDTDTLTGATNRIGDLTHLNATGANGASGLWRDKIQAALP